MSACVGVRSFAVCAVCMRRRRRLCAVVAWRAQVDEDLYMGPSGEADDYVNHSCDPNSAFLHRNGDHFLVALKPIAAGTELTFDYRCVCARHCDVAAPCERKRLRVAMLARWIIIFFWRDFAFFDTSLGEQRARLVRPASNCALLFVAADCLC